MKHVLQNVAVAATSIEIGTNALLELAGEDLNGTEFGELEQVFAQELHVNIMEKVEHV